MAPDDIFAAQFWPWPDPAIKRDNQGRVLFVNAAFLQLYGGTVQDWTGHVIGGWPAPQGPGQPYRFETRISVPHDTAEQVYDWLEMTLADGNAFALARNVTIFAQSPVTQPMAAQIAAERPVQDSQMETGQIANTQTTEPHIAADMAAPTHDTQVMSAEDTAQAPEFEHSSYEAPTYEAPAYEAPAYEDTLAEEMTHTPQNLEPSASHEPVIFAEHVAEPVISTNELHTEPVGGTQPAPQVNEQIQAVETTPIQAGTPPVQNAALNTSNDPDRAYERRALPLENENAVLGNNWRDAVIAKAVGADIQPAAEADMAQSSTPQASLAAQGGDDPHGPKRILLAEDNAINALLTRTLLEAEGHTVETVQDGQLAVEAMKTSTYDLIFMDMRMPNMDGLEATRKIRTLPNVSKHLPIIALTANAFDDDRNACFDSGMNDFMTKPVSAEELSEMVTQWTGPKEDRMAS